MPIPLKPEACSLKPRLAAVSIVVGMTMTCRLSPAEEPSASPPTPPPSEQLPEPDTWKQKPEPVREAMKPVGPNRLIELGFDAGAMNRPERTGRVKYGVAPTVGAHARVDILKWLGARIVVRWESVPVTFDEGALGLPLGTTYSQPDLHRVYLGANFEPTWHPNPLLALWTGLGVGWGRATADPLHTTGAEQVTLPIRSAVFVEVPFSFGARYEIIKDWMVVNVSGQVAFFWGDQSGALLNPYSTPGKSGSLVTVGGFPELGRSIGVLAGLGCFL